MRIFILGAGGHARVIMSLVRAAGSYEIAGLFDDDDAKHGDVLDGVPILGSIAEFDADGETAVLAVGDNARRCYLAGLTGATWATLIHPHSWIDPGADIREGTVVFAGAVIQAGAQLGEHSIVNTSAAVDHDCVVGKFVHLAPRAVLAGEVTIGDGALIGVGAAVSPGTRVGAWARIGEGAVVASNIDDHIDAVGVPARPIRSNA